VRSVDATQYWFWDGYFGLNDTHDLDGERWGRLGVDSTICFRISLALIDDPQQKTTGYRQAVSELLKWVAPTSDSPSSALARVHLLRLTGQDFNTRGEWLSWWEQNRAFVLWSEDEGRLEVVSEALEAGAVISDDAVVLDAEEYWFYAGRGWILDEAPVGDYVVGSLRIPPHGFEFRASAAALNDRTAKESGYRRAVDNLVADGLLAEQVEGSDRESIIARLAALTGLSLADRQSWINWWNENRERLVLSRDGENLVVRD